MYTLNYDELNKTKQEKSILENLEGGFNGAVIGVTNSYQERLLVIQNHLKNIYGEFADWESNLGCYLRSPEYLGHSRVVGKVDEIEEITTDDIRATLKQVQKYKALEKEAMDLNERFKKSHSVNDLIRAAELYGILPMKHEGTGDTALIDYYVLFPKNSDERQKIRDAVISNDNLLAVLALVTDLIASCYINGSVLTFPFVGSTIAQSRSRVFWRGENAYYGTSRASIYRGKEFKELPQDVFLAIRKMRYDECGLFLDKFSAPFDWTLRFGDVNFMAVMQHYGLPTDMIDITSDLMVALFFACCKWEGNDISSLGHWIPLKQSDFHCPDSRKHISDLGGDSRYGIIYRAPADIEDIRWIAVDPEDTVLRGVDVQKISKGEMEYYRCMNHIMPVGYQPFARCKNQSAYMLLTSSLTPDLLLNPMFEKYRFRLDEVFCQWVYDEMDGGRKIYPNDDIPNLSHYIGKIANTRIFSKEVFENYCGIVGYSDNKADHLKKRLRDYGYLISDDEVEFIKDCELEAINEKYTLDDAFRLAGVEVSSKPLIVI